jgi:hypothetical protein
LASIAPTTSYLGNSQTWSYYSLNGQIYTNGSGTSYGATYANDDVIGIALDLDNDQLTFYKNGTSQGVAVTGLTDTYTPACGNDQASVSYTFNFGQRAFVYTSPSGFKALVDTNLPTPVVAKPSDLFDAKIYSGNGTSSGSTQAITGLSFSPDLVWIKARSVTAGHALYDVIRGTNSRLSSSQTNAEFTGEGFFNSFDSTGFTVAGNGNNTNATGETYVGWAWDAGTSTVTNTAGSITSQVRANPTAGFSVITYTGGGVDGSVGHGLGVAPKIYIVKNRSAVSNWAVAYTIVDGSLDFMFLNLTNAAGNATQSVPTSTVINLQQSAGETTNGNNYVIYAFTSVAGYSSFGSYTGNGSADGPFVYTGFRPRWVLYKESSVAGSSWEIIDAARNPYNASNARLFPDSSGAENTAQNALDLLSNGFKPRATYGGNNASGATYIWAAFAESPFAYSRAR